MEESPEGVAVSAELHHTAQYCRTPGGEREEVGGGGDKLEGGDTCGRSVCSQGVR